MVIFLYINLADYLYKLRLFMINTFNSEVSFYLDINMLSNINKIIYVSKITNIKLKYMLQISILVIFVWRDMNKRFNAILPTLFFKICNVSY